ncbi:MAG: cytosolic protein [Candidatus Omnitrophica bacterium]|nr:cytosolic protein [Candidatus Omnitrophota bacterium]
MADCNNQIDCPCTYSGCDKHGKCCECLQYHLRMQQLPACCFPPDVERTYDRSFRKFIQTYQDRV